MKENEKKLEVRRYSRTDNQELSRVMNNTLGVTRDERYCEWKYAENPAGIAISSVAQQGASIIGQIGIIPVRFYVGGKQVVGAQEVDFLIEEEHRSLNVLYQLSRLRSQIYEQEHIAFCYGFTTPSTGVIAQKAVNFVRVGPIPRLVKVLDAGPFLRKKFPLRILSTLLSKIANSGLELIYRVREKIPEGTQIRTIKRFDERFDSFWNRIKTDYSIMTVRDAAYLNWRYVLPPHADYQILALEKKATTEVLGFIVLGYKDRGDIPIGQIVDLVTPRDESGEVARCLLARAIRNFRKQKVALVVCWMFSHCHVFSELARFGFRYRQESGRDFVVEIHNPQNHAVPQDLIMKRENWYITIGDSDSS